MSRQDDQDKPGGVSGGGDPGAADAPANFENDKPTNDADAISVPTQNAQQNVIGSQTNSINQQLHLPNVREDMVKKATDFLLLEPIHNQSPDKKFQFLRSRGLTDQEIHAAFKRASSLYYYSNSQPLQAKNGTIQTPINSQGWFGRLFGPFAYAIGIAYIGYQIYKKYIENWLFGYQKPPLEKRFDELQLTVQKCMEMLKENTAAYAESLEDRQREIAQIHGELKSVKSLLLHRSQFPPAPTFSTLPQWQLQKNLKPSAEPVKMVNGAEKPGTSTPNTPLRESTDHLQQSCFPTLNGFVKVENTNCILNFRPKQSALPTSNVENTTKSNEQVDPINNDDQLNETKNVENIDNDTVKENAINFLQKVEDKSD